MKKRTYIQAIAIMLLGIFITSCDQDESVPSPDRENATLADVTEDNVTVNEGDNWSFTIRQDNLIDETIDSQELWAWVSGQIGVRVIGGTATEGVDYTFNIPSVYDISIYLLQDGYYYDYDASVSIDNIVNDIITINNDGIVEGEETIELQFFPVGLGQVIIDDTLTITIND